MQEFVHVVAEHRDRESGSISVILNTPKNGKHRFRMSVRKIADEYKLTNKLIITLNDLDYDRET